MKLWMTLAAVAAILVVAGCGGSSSGSGSAYGSGAHSSSTAAAPPASVTSSAASAAPPATPSGGAQALHLSAVPGQLAFNTTHLSAKAGTVTLVMTNPSSFSHGVSITGPGVNTAGKVVAGGGTSTVTAKLKPGTYTFFCPVPGHRQAGMQGTLTVT